MDNEQLEEDLLLNVSFEGCERSWRKEMEKLWTATLIRWRQMYQDFRNGRLNWHVPYVSHFPRIEVSICSVV
jgi:hypothetical protein